MRGSEFIDKVKALGKRKGIPVEEDKARGKGSHRTLTYGTNFTVVRNAKDELKKGTLHGMCRQLGISSNDL